MKYMKEVTWICSFTMAGELLKFFLPWPVPAGVYGLFLLLLALVTGFVKLSDLEGTGHFLLDIMPLLFIPAGVGLLERVDEIRGIWIPLFVIVVVSTLFVMTITGKVAQYIIRKNKSREE